MKCLKVTIIHFKVSFSFSILNTIIILKFTMAAKIRGSSMLKSFKNLLECILFLLDR